jgi:hypothetical protein
MLLDSIRLNFDCVDPALLGHFWSAVTGYQVMTNEAALVRLQGRALRVGELVFREVDRWKAAPNRLQLDLLTDDLDAETERLVALGASPAGEAGTEGERRRLLRDPEGNEFALVEAPGRPRRVTRRPSTSGRGARRPPGGSGQGRGHGDGGAGNGGEEVA